MFKKLGKRTKALGVVVTSGVVTSAAQAQIAFDETTKKFTGEFDLTTYFSATEIVVGTLGIILAIGLAIKQFRKTA